MPRFTPRNPMHWLAMAAPSAILLLGPLIAFAIHKLDSPEANLRSSSATVTGGLVALPVAGLASLALGIWAGREHSNIGLQIIGAIGWSLVIATCNAALAFSGCALFFG